VLAFIRDDLGEGEEESRGGLTQKGEDGVFGLLTELVVVTGRQGADYQLFHSVHVAQFQKYYKEGMRGKWRKGMRGLAMRG
jgi:hypothetical protein